MSGGEGSSVTGGRFTCHMENVAPQKSTSPMAGLRPSGNGASDLSDSCAVGASIARPSTCNNVSALEASTCNNPRDRHPVVNDPQYIRNRHPALDAGPIPTDAANVTDVSVQGCSTDIGCDTHRPQRSTSLMAAARPSGNRASALNDSCSDKNTPTYSFEQIHPASTSNRTYRPRVGARGDVKLDVEDCNDNDSQDILGCHPAVNGRQGTLRSSALTAVGARVGESYTSADTGPSPTDAANGQDESHTRCSTVVLQSPQEPFDTHAQLPYGRLTPMANIDSCGRAMLAPTDGYKPAPASPLSPAKPLIAQGAPV
jgi:hypothetical protein